MRTISLRDGGRQTADRRRRSAVGGHLSPASEILQHAVVALTAAAADSPRLTAEILLAHLLGVSRARLLSRPERSLSAQTLAKYEALIARAADGEPLAYLTGHREFCGLDFLVDARVLVPRPETELLIDLALNSPLPAGEGLGVRESSLPLHILDVGTGSGCIAVALAVRRPVARITAVDISAGALALARLNAARHRVADRIDFIQSDLLSTFHLRPSTFHLLVANLPYIPSGELKTLPVSKHEPALALDGGPDGLDLIRRLLADAPRVMAPHGRLLLEINDAKRAEACDLARTAFPSAHIELHTDFAGLDRVVAITL
jgi:release factor glutamine methyltransferase